MGSVPESPFIPQRQNTVDMIGELPDIDFFSIPGAEAACWPDILLLAEPCTSVFALVHLVTRAVWLTVDDFYDDYVTELGTRNSRKLSGK